MTHITVYGDVTYLASIYCKTCGVSAKSRHRTNLHDVCSLSVDTHLQYVFNNTLPDIPVGWAMSGRDKLYCPNCWSDKR